MAGAGRGGQLRGHAGVLGVLGREGCGGAATKNFSKPGQVLRAGSVEGHGKKGGNKRERKI